MTRKDQLHQETDRMVEDYQAAERAVNEWNQKESEIRREYEGKINSIDFFRNIGIKGCMLAGFFPLFLSKPWTWVYGMGFIIFFTLGTWVLSTPLVSFLILAPAFNIFKKIKIGILEKERERELNIFSNTKRQEIQNIKERYPAYGYYSSWEGIIDSRSENEGNTLIKELSMRRKLFAQQFDSIFPYALRDTIEKAIEWIQNHEVHTKAELLERAWALREIQERNAAEFASQRADNARRFGEDREKIKYLDQLAGRNLKERIDADRKWDYGEEDSNLDRF